LQAYQVKLKEHYAHNLIGVELRKICEILIICYVCYIQLLMGLLVFLIFS